MNKLRLEEKNKIKLKIKELLFLNDRYDEKIINIKKLSDNTFNRNIIDSLKNNIIEHRDNLILLEKRLSDLASGIIDNELQNISSESTKLINKKSKETSDKKIIKKKEKEKDRQISQKYYHATRKNDREIRYYNNGVNREVNYFYKKLDTIPDYIIKNLKTMPNNKGYMWRGIHCYGERKCEKNNKTVLFEKRRGVLTIHEWIRGEDFTQYIISEKIQQGRYKKTNVIHNTMKKNIK